MEMFDIFFLVAVIVFSAVIHEVAHGVAADKLGDPTARYAGRLTLNPIVHLDAFGSVFLPLILAITGSPLLFGWAKPVPYNPYNLRPGRFSEAMVAFAGPLSNLIIALIFAFLLRVELFAGAGTMLFTVVLVNVMLFLFNLIPIPPLDGSKILSAILPGPLARQYAVLRNHLEMNPFFGFGIVLVVVLALGSYLGGAVFGLARLLVGM